MTETTPLQDSHEPEVSIILSVWNDARWLETFVASVRAQQFENFELLAVDDGSSDSSYELLRSYDDPRIRVFRNETRRHWLNAVNDMAVLARGRLLKIMCADDQLRPECLSRHVELHRRRGDLGYSFSDYEMIDPDANVVGASTDFGCPGIITPELAYSYFMERGCWLGTSTICVPKARWIEAGGLRDVTTHNPDRIPVAEDFDLAVRLSAGHPAGYISLPLVGIRTHPLRLSETVDIRGLNVEANLAILKDVARVLDAGAPARRGRAQQLLVEKGAGGLNIGLHYLLKGKVKAAVDIFRAVFTVLPVSAVLREWLKRMTGKAVRLSFGRR